MHSSFNALREHVSRENDKYDYKFFIPNLEEVSNFLRLSPEWIEDQIELKNVNCIYDTNGEMFFSPKEFFFLFLFRELNSSDLYRRKAWSLIDSFREKIQLKSWDEIEQLNIYVCDTEIALMADPEVRLGHREMEKAQNVYKDYEVFDFEISGYCENMVDGDDNLSAYRFNQIWKEADALYLKLYPDVERLGA